MELLTEKHHAESRVEAARLRRLGAGLITDSFGESRWVSLVTGVRGERLTPNVQVDGRDREHAELWRWGL